jgi:hypothetical protein
MTIGPLPTEQGATDSFHGRSFGMTQERHALDDDAPISSLGWGRVPDGGWAVLSLLLRAGMSTLGQLEWGMADRVPGAIDQSHYPVLEAVLSLARRIGRYATVPLPFAQICDESAFEVLPFNRFGLEGLELRAILGIWSRSPDNDLLTVDALKVACVAETTLPLGWWQWALLKTVLVYVETNP